MKQIFDWLREQINNERRTEFDERDEFFNSGLEFALEKVDEAEAKWEKDCCEWKVLHEKCFIQNPHSWLKSEVKE